MKIIRQENPKGEAFSCDECGESTKRFFYSIQGDHAFKENHYENDVAICSKCFRRLRALISQAMANIVTTTGVERQ